MPVPVGTIYSKLRRHAATLLREHRWLAPAATALSATALSLAIVFQFHSAVGLAAAGCLLASAFVWGYSTRALRMPPWPALAHLQRRQYAETWDALASSRKAAAIAVSGKGWEDELRSSAAQPVRNLIELASVSEQDDVLEIGCGIGRIGLELAPQCRSWTGADISANMLSYAARRLRDARNVRLQQLHGGGLTGFAGHSFDVVYATNMLAHLDEVDRWRYVQDAFRVLRPGGRIFLDTMDLTSDEGWTLFAGSASQSQDLERPPYSPRFSAPAELTTYAARAGFASVQAHSRPPLIIVTAVKPVS